MADRRHNSKRFTDHGGPEEEGGRVKTKPVSSSTEEGAGTAGKRSAQHIASEDFDDESDSSNSPPAPRKISKIGFGLSSQMGKKSNPISIKLGATPKASEDIDDESDSSNSPPTPRKISKIGFGLSSQMGKKSNPISIKLGATKPKEPVVPAKKPGLTSVFNDDSDDDEGAGTAGKRSAQDIASEDFDDESDSSNSPPAPRKISKIGFGLSSQMGKKSNPISIKLGATKPKEPVVPAKKPGLATVFNDDSDDDEGAGTAGKRSAQDIASEDFDDESDSSNSPPAPRKISKIGFGLSSQMGKKSNPISIKLGATKPKEPVVPAKKPGLASVFNDDSDDSEPEEMPAEAKMRMKNVGRETPTSAGPNSFNKGKQGFSDHQKLWERKLKAQTEKP